MKIIPSWLTIKNIIYSHKKDIKTKSIKRKKKVWTELKAAVFRKCIVTYLGLPFDVFSVSCFFDHNFPPLHIGKQWNQLSVTISNWSIDNWIDGLWFVNINLLILIFLISEQQLVNSSDWGINKDWKMFKWFMVLFIEINEIRSLD